jgi:hypothetical protein
MLGFEKTPIQQAISDNNLGGEILVKISSKTGISSVVIPGLVSAEAELLITLERGNLALILASLLQDCKLAAVQASSY